MTGHASRRSQPATPYTCECGRPIRFCCPAPRWRHHPNSTAVWLEKTCCHCLTERLSRLAAETARLIQETEP
jgi:hypothetical protein